MCGSEGKICLPVASVFLLLVLGQVFFLRPGTFSADPVPPDTISQPAFVQLSFGTSAFFPPKALGLCLGGGWEERTTTQQRLAVVSSWTFERQNQDPRPTLLSGPAPRKLRKERNNSVTFGFSLLMVLLNWRPLGPRETGHSVPRSLRGRVLFLKVPYCGKIKLCV